MKENPEVVAEIHAKIRKKPLPDVVIADGESETENACLSGDVGSYLHQFVKQLFKTHY